MATATESRLEAIDERLSRIEVRLERACAGREECELRCAAKREGIYGRIVLLEVAMGKLGVQTGAIVGIVVGIVSTVATLLLKKWLGL